MSERLDRNTTELATIAAELVQFVKPSSHNLGKCILYLLAMQTGGDDLEWAADNLAAMSKPYRGESMQ